MRVIHLPAALLLAASIAACGTPHVDVEPGVSLELAKHRAANISNINYELRFSIPEAVDGRIAGTVSISFSLADNTRPLQLDFRESGDNIDRVISNGSASEFEFTQEHIVIPPAELSVGRNVIEVVFTAGATSLNRNPEYLYTLFVPDRARTAFPLFDQPDLKATYDLTLAVPPGWTAMSNAPVSRVHYGIDAAEYRFEQSDIISSYLFSFVAGKFETISREIDSRHLTMLHRETDAEKVARNVDEIFNLHVAALDWLEDYSGIEYPYRKFGFALIPAFQYGGMEHVGAIQYRASSLLLDEAPSETQLLGRAGLIAHETAHMWFGNLVTMEWFNDVWTKEVFASFMAGKIVNPSFPDTNHDLNFLVRNYPRAYSVDRTAGANPIRQHLPNLNEAGQMYGAIIYNKAPIMMRKLEKIIGEDLFREGMQEYLQTYSFANATWPALIDILDRKSDEDLHAWSQAWVNTPGREATEVQWDTAAEGEGGALRYGLVPANPGSIDAWEALGEVERAAELINLYEQMLAGAGPDPAVYFERLVRVAGSERNPLVLDLALGQISNIFWKFLPDTVRDELAPLVEKVLWESMLAEDDASQRKVYFQALAGVVLTPAEVAKVHDVWSGALEVDKLPLAENDLIDIMQAIAVSLAHNADEIVATQIARTENPDNIRKLEFIAPSLSADVAVRDAFFDSLADESNRQTESWVLDALSNLHHPLRRADSERYILPSLKLLKEIQETGDIFFPKRWLDETLANHRTDTAVSTVRGFLEEQPDYNEQLRMKILQSADTMFRANKILAGQ